MLSLEWVAVTVLTCGCSLSLLGSKSSEDVSALDVDVTEVVESRCVHHTLAVSDTAPDRSLDVLAVLDSVLFHLFDVLVLRCPAMATNGLVEACVQRVSLLEWSEQGLLLLFSLLVREYHVCAEGCKVLLEAAALSNSVGPWLITVDDQIVLSGILISALVLLALVRVLRVTDLVQVCERLSLDTSAKPWSRLRHGASGRAKRHILKL